MILLELFWTFFQVGILGFGGGYAFLPLMQTLVVGAGYLSPAQFLSLLAVAEVTPGPVGLNTATYVGFQAAGIPGALAANLGVTAPTLLLVFLLAGFLARHRTHPLLRGLFGGLRPVTTALILAAAWFVGQGGLFAPALNFWALGLFLSLLGLAFWNRVHPLVLMAGAGTCGILFTLGGLW